MKSSMGNRGTRLIVATACLIGFGVAGRGAGESKPKGKVKSGITIGNLEQGFGNAEGIGGGDAVDGQLTVARKDIGQALRLLKEQPELSAEFCSVDRCPIGLSTKACEQLRALSESQRNECRAVGRGLAQAFAGKLGVVFQITDKPLTVSEGSAVRPVAAQTELSEQGEIRFQRDRIAPLSSADLIALVAHELGHKFQSGKGFITDGIRAGAFASGRELLDTVGAATAVFSIRFRVPLQAPPALPKTVEVASYCGAQGEFFTGVSTDVEGAVAAGVNPQTESERFQTALGRVTSKAARSRFIAETLSKYFQRQPTSDETSMLTISLAQGGSPSAVLASVLADPEYLNSRRIQSDEDFVGHLYRELLGRSPFGLEVGRGVAILKSEKRVAFVVRLLESDPTAQEPFVRRWYRDYLNREPEGGEIRAHSAQMRAGISWESVQADILASPEYLALQKKRREICALPKK